MAQQALAETSADSYADPPVLPSIQQDKPRRRNRALATQRRTRAIEMASSGYTYEQIARALGYSNRGTVHHIVHRGLAKQEARAVDQMRQRQGDRLDGLLAGIWSRAMHGDVRAVNTAARLIMSQCKLYGLI